MSASDKPATSLGRPSAHRDIPTEVLSQITRHLDLPSSLAFARAARRFTAVAEPRIWSNLKLSLPAHYGLSAYVPPEGLSTWELDVWHKTEIAMAEERHQVVMRDMLRAVLSRGNEERWRMVKRVKMTLRPGVVQGMMTILDLVSNHVRRLEVCGLTSDVFVVQGTHTDFINRLDEFDTILLHQFSTLHFDKLTHLRIGPSSVLYPSTILLLCALAPSLISLDANTDHRDRDHGYHHDFRMRTETCVAPHHTPLALQTLRFYGREDECYDETGDTAVLIRLIQSSPRLRQLYVGISLDAEEYLQDILWAASARDGLQELRVWTPMGMFNADLEENPTGKRDGFAHLRKLVFYYKASLDFFLDIPKLPVLESIFLLYDKEYNQDHEFVRANFAHARSPSASHIPTLLPTFTARLRNSPKLQNMIAFPRNLNNTKMGFFDRLQAHERTNKHHIGRITSLRHGAEELLHVRLLLDYREVADVSVYCDDYEDGHHAVILYTAADGTPRQKIFAPLDKAEWLDSWDYEGRAVPLEVVEQMRAVAGLNGEESRGVEVGDAAWKVLTEWMAVI